MRAIDKARAEGVPIRDYGTDYRVPCPKCSPERRKKKDPCLHVTIEGSKVKWFCHHCEAFKGEVEDDDGRRRPSQPGGFQSAATRSRARRWW